MRDYIVKNGNDGYAFEKSLHTREFEPDNPNFTPRISGILDYDFKANDVKYKLSILKSSDGEPLEYNTMDEVLENANKQF